MAKFQKGNPGGPGRPYGRGNKREGYKLIPKQAVSQTVQIIAPLPARTETADERLAEYERQQRWENSEAGKMAALHQPSEDELQRRARALDARNVNKGLPRTESLRPRNVPTFGIVGRADTPETALARRWIAAAEQRALEAHNPRRAPATWSPLDPFNPWSSK